MVLTIHIFFLQDLLVSLVKSVGGAENVLSTPMDWSPVAKGRAALVTVDAKGFCILLSASLNSSDNSVQQGFREKLATNEVLIFLMKQLEFD